MSSTPLELMRQVLTRGVGERHTPDTYLDRVREQCFPRRGEPLLSQAQAPRARHGAQLLEEGRQPLGRVQGAPALLARERLCGTTRDLLPQEALLGLLAPGEPLPARADSHPTLKKLLAGRGTLHSVGGVTRSCPPDSWCRLSWSWPSRAPLAAARHPKHSPGRQRRRPQRPRHPHPRARGRTRTRFA